MAFFPRRSVFPFFLQSSAEFFVFVSDGKDFFWAGRLVGRFLLIACFLMSGIVEFLEDACVFVVVEWIFSVTHGDAVNVTCLRSYFMCVFKDMIVDMSSIPLRNLNKYYSLSWLAACL